MTHCIYCLEDKTDDHFQRAEHVMPQSFGKFESNFTLHGVVCDECNHILGNELELALGRDTFEGHARFKHGLKKPADFKPFRDKRVTFKLTEGPFAGCHAYTEYSEETGKIHAVPVPQVGFLIASGNYEYFPNTEIPTQDELEKRGFDGSNPKSIVSLCMDPDEAKRVLAEKGIAFNIKGVASPDVPREDIGVEMSLTIDDIVWRAVAKIAFNYLAYFQGCEFALHPAFDVIRRFIRYGERPDYPLIQVTDEAILGDEPIEGERRLGNLVTTDIAIDGVSICAQVSLLNALTYRVALAVELPDAPPVGIRRGHFFNLGNHRILELEAREKLPSAEGSST
jgi:hypothetical protein